MAEAEQQVQQAVESDDENEAKIEYKAPAKKTIDEILKTDEDDESLKRYKQQLLGNAAETEFWPGKPDVILRKMVIEIEQCPDRVIELNLEDPTQLQNVKFAMKEGVVYQIKLQFTVQRQIVSGMKFRNKVSRGPIVTKEEHMVGSFGPKKEVQEFRLPKEELPSGLTGRGEYKVKSMFTDDDKNEILSWNWLIQVKKDWKD